MKKKALIYGATGQDGSYMAELLLKKGYRVLGVMRRLSMFNTERIEHLYTAYPKDFDIYHDDLNDLQIDSPSKSLELIKTTLQNKGFKSGEDIISLNSAAVIYVSDLVNSFEKAFEIAIDVIKSGSGLDKLEELATFSNNFNESA